MTAVSVRMTVMVGSFLTARAAPATGGGRQAAAGAAQFREGDAGDGREGCRAEHL
jgi:hypothetical protein